ncbi:hypothetical protein M3J09_010728 [Ascochyta lentis]
MRLSLVCCFIITLMVSVEALYLYSCMSFLILNVDLSIFGRHCLQCIAFASTPAPSSKLDKDNEHFHTF